MQVTTRVLLAAALAFPLTGCAAAVLGAAGAAGAAGVILYSQNEAKADFIADLDRVWSAAVAATKRAGFPVAGNLTHGPTGGEFEAGDAEVVVEQHPGGKTRVRVRIGTFRTDEHKRVAKLILEDIGKQLA